MNTNYLFKTPQGSLLEPETNIHRHTTIIYRTLLDSSNVFAICSFSLVREKNMMHVSRPSR